MRVQDAGLTMDDWARWRRTPDKHPFEPSSPTLASEMTTDNP